MCPCAGHSKLLCSCMKSWRDVLTLKPVCSPQPRTSSARAAADAQANGDAGKKLNSIGTPWVHIYLYAHIYIYISNTYIYIYMS